MIVSFAGSSSESEALILAFADSSAESEALRLSFSYLVNNIIIHTILYDALSRNLISKHQREECAGVPDLYERAKMFLGHLQRARIIIPKRLGRFGLPKC